MNSNQTVLKALAAEGVVVTEEDLLHAFEGGRRIPATEISSPNMSSLDDLVIIARPALAKGSPHGSLPVRLGTPGETYGTIAPETKTEHPVPGGGGADEELAHGIEGKRRGIRALAGRAMCCLGIHPAPWVYLREGECNQLRDCRRCATTRIRVKHRRGWQYLRSNFCQQTKVCQRCGHHQGFRTNHEAWSESWEVDRRWWAGEKRRHRCRRCGVVEEWTVNDGD